MASNKKNITLNSIFGERPALGDTIFRLRKCARVSQGELGEMLGVHQSAVSRIENGEQNLTPGELLELGKFFGVRVDDLLHGSVNYWKVAEQFGQDPPFPARYSEHAHSRVREIWPLLLFLIKTKGHRYTSKLQRELGVDNLLFMNPDQRVGVNLYLDMLRYGLRTRALTAESLPRLVQFARLELMHEPLSAIYKAQASSLALVQDFLLNSSFYESNFEYRIEGISSRNLEVSIAPREHLSKVDYRDEVLGDFLCRYKKQHFSHFPLFIGNNPLKLIEEECHFRGAPRCIYKISAA